MKRRANLAILMDVLGNLLEGSKGPTRLAQSCNLSYDDLVKFAKILLERGFIQVSTEKSRELYSITPAGIEIHREYRRFSDALLPPEM